MPILPDRLEDLSIHAEVIDEWYGIMAIFNWPEGYVYPGNLSTSDELALAKHVASLVIKSPAYARFYERKRVVICEEDGAGNARMRRVTIPQFNDPRDYTDWGFYRTHEFNWISASTR